MNLKKKKEKKKENQPPKTWSGLYFTISSIPSECVEAW